MTAAPPPQPSAARVGPGSVLVSVTSSFISPLGQLSADGTMEVVTWGPADGFGYH